MTIDRAMPPRWKEVLLEECGSTFTEARRNPAWTIVSTVRQTHGRGRFNRAWFGEPGGLWMSCNLPLAGDAPWGMLPLVAGAALFRALQPLRIPGLRLRWPNDLMVRRGKLAGILVERPAADLASVGIGMNVFNDVLSLHGRTADVPVRLADLAAHCPRLPQLRHSIADALADTFAAFAGQGAAALIPMLEPAWGSSLPVVAVTDSARVCGFFHGIQADGSPILRRADGSFATVPAVAVNALRELV